MEKFFSSPLWSYLVLFLAFLFSFLLYEAKVSEGGDDSAYVFRAYDFLHNGTFPTFQGPVYPIFLAMFMAVFGLNIQVFKILSLLSMLGFFWVFFRAYKNRIPSATLVLTGLLLALNAYVLYFASQTYSEALFMLAQMAFFGFFFKNFIEKEDTGWKEFLFLGLYIAFLGNLRSIGFAAAFGVGAFLLFEKRWRDLLFSVVSVGGVVAAVEGIKRLFTGTDLQVASQGSSLLLKDPYKPTDGNEDLAGMIDRFTGNADLYISKHTVKFLGLRPMDFNETRTWVTYLVIALMVVAFIGIWKKNRYLKFTGLYTAVLLAVTFIVLQTRWDQYRLIVPFFPLLLVFLYGGLTIFLKERAPALRNAVPVVAAFFVLTAFRQTAEKVGEHQEEFKAALQGDVLAGYSPDWRNYILMSEYAGEHVPDSVMVGCRKAGISFIYGKRQFFGITKIPFDYADSLFVSGRTYLILEKKQADQLLSARPDWGMNQLGFAFGKPKEGQTEVTENDFYTILSWTDSLSHQEASIIASTMNLRVLGSGAEFLDRFEDNYLINPDLLLRNLKDNRVGYVIMANLRRNPKVRDGYTINTIQRYLYYIQLKYPNALRQVQKIGVTEEANLIQVVYPPGL